MRIALVTYRGKHLLCIDIIVNCQPLLFHIVDTRCSAGRFTCLLNSRKKEPYKDTDNCNDNKKFDQGKTPAIICVYNSTSPLSSPKKYQERNITLKNLSRRIKRFFKTSCFGTGSFLLGTKTACTRLHVVGKQTWCETPCNQIKRFAMPLRLNPEDSRVVFHQSSTFWHPDYLILLPPCHDREFFRPARYSYDP